MTNKICVSRNIFPLHLEIQTLEGHREAFKTPPIEWIQHGLTNLQKALEKKTEESALILRRLLGSITLMPIKADIGKDFYRVSAK